MSDNNLIALVDGQDVIILNREGLCVASSDLVRVGNVSNTQKIKSLDKVELDFGQVKIDLYFRKNQYSDNEFALFKNLTRLTLSQYLSAVIKPISSVDQFIIDLVESAPSPQSAALNDKKAQSFGLNLKIRRVAILIKIDAFEERYLMSNQTAEYTSEDIIGDWKDKVESVVLGFFTLEKDAITAYIGNGLFVVFKEVSKNESRFFQNMKQAYSSIFEPLINDTDGHLSVAYSNAYSGIQGLYEAYHEALKALQFGEIFVTGKNAGFYYGDLGAIRILSEESAEKKRSYAKEILDPLDKETLRATLKHFLNENMDIKKTAKKLKVHPNTVNYRLGKIAENLGLDPRVFKQAFELRIALLTEDIFD